MNYSEMTTYNRLEYIIDTFFGSSGRFAELMGMNPNSLSNYKGKAAKSDLGRKHLKTLETIGISEIFYKHGLGSPFADNENGRALAKKFPDLVPKQEFSVIGEANMVQIPDLTNMTPAQMKEFLEKFYPTIKQMEKTVKAVYGDGALDGTK